jgi:hypothetical protein
VSLGEATITRDVRLEDPRDLPRVPAHLNATRSSELRLAANNSKTSGRVAILPAERTEPASAIATAQKSQMHIQPDRPHRTPFVEFTDTGKPWANDTGGSALAAQPGSRRGGHRTLGLSRPPSQAACHAAFSRRPLIQVPDRHPRPGRRPRAAC